MQLYWLTEWIGRQWSLPRRLISQMDEQREAWEAGGKRQHIFTYSVWAISKELQQIWVFHNVEEMFNEWIFKSHHPLIKGARSGQQCVVKGHLLEQEWHHWSRDLGSPVHLKCHLALWLCCKFRQRARDHVCQGVAGACVHCRQPLAERIVKDILGWETSTIPAAGPVVLSSCGAHQQVQSHWNEKE